MLLVPVAGIAHIVVWLVPVAFGWSFDGIAVASLVVVGMPDGPLQMVVVLPSGRQCARPCAPAWSLAVAFVAPAFWILVS